MRRSRWSDWCLCGLFVSVLVAGGAVSLINVWRDRADLAALAKSGWNWFPSKFESFFNDRLVARKQMTAMLGRMKMRWLKSSPTPRVWVGRDEWLFYNHNADPIYYRRIDQEMPVLVDYWTRDLMARRQLVEERGAKYLLVFAPNKQSVHPEFLLTANWEPGKTTLDRVIERCRRDPALNILDLREPLKKAKEEQPVYLRFDSHWNHFGAYAAYSAILQSLAKWDARLAPHPFSFFVPHFDYYENCDLAGLVGLGDKLLDETTAIAIGITRSRLTSESVPRNSTTLDHVSSFVSERRGESLPRAVLLMDSFGEYPALWLREHFSRLVAVGTYSLDLDVIEKERPDFVIQLIVERQLDGRKSFQIDPSELRRY